MTEVEYMTKMEALYHKEQEERSKFLSRYYPIDPFDGSWIRAENCPPEVLARAFHCQEQINRDSSGRFKPSHNAVQELSSPLAELPLIRVTDQWLETRREHAKAMVKVAKAMASGSPDEIIDQAFSVYDDEQLYQLLQEVVEEFATLLSLTPTANCECCDDQMGRDECF